MYEYKNNVLCHVYLRHIAYSIYIILLITLLFKKNTGNKIINITICKAKIINQIFLC